MQPLTTDSEIKKHTDHIFSGNILLLYAYDVGEDISLKKIEESRDIIKMPLHLPKHFKQYHTPLAIELPHPHSTSHCMSSKIHSLGAISLIYKIPFTDTLENLRLDCTISANKFQEQSVIDAKAIYRKILRFYRISDFRQRTRSRKCRQSAVASK